MFLNNIIVCVNLRVKKREVDMKYPVTPVIMLELMLSIIAMGWEML